MMPTAPVIPLMMLATGLAAGGIVFYMNRWLYVGLIVGIMLLTVWLMVADWRARLPRAERPNTHRHEMGD